MLASVHDNLGRGHFLGLFFASAAIGAYASLSVFVLRNILFTSAVGASNVVTALIAAQCVLLEGCV